MKLITFLITLLLFNYVNSLEKKNIKNKLSKLKKQTVIIHNDILKNNDELKKIKIDIDRNAQKQIIFKRHIKNKEYLGRKLVFLLQEKIYLSPLMTITKNLTSKSEDIITKQIVRRYFLKEVKNGINEFFVSLEGIGELRVELVKNSKMYEKKKDDLEKKLKNLEKKIREVAALQKKIKIDQRLKIKEKKLKKKAKNLNELVSKAKNVKKVIIKKNRAKIQMPVQGLIISDFGEGRDFHKLKNGLVFKVKEDSFVTSPINGTVIYANKFRGYGNLVMIEDNNGYTCVLIGMKNLLVSSGNEVLKGEPIAKISPSLRSQLYFELRQNGKVINPKSKVEIL
ncbi:MAG: hypothetical protein CMM95_01570 [Rickettsiales bacterium]|nr:hypothetical protein [Rickettsiales bacterium]|tara:strand:- start:176 stop:1192 length:1017 start_codon:yes stop_codon:yes gene_type:complete